MRLSNFSYPFEDLESYVPELTEDILDFTETIMTKIVSVEDPVLRSELVGICSLLHHHLKEYYKISGESEHIRLARSSFALYKLSRMTTERISDTAAEVLES